MRKMRLRSKVPSGFAALLLGAVIAGTSLAADPPALKPHKIVGQPLEGLRVAIDVGHSKAAPGAASARGVNEFDFNLATARIVTKTLEKAGATVIFVNEKGNIQGLMSRTLIAAKAKADCFISIHHDSVNEKYKKKWIVDGKPQHYADNFRGYSVFASQKNDEAESSKALATHVGEAIHATGLRPTMHHNEKIQGENRAFIDKRTGVYEFSDLIVLKSAPMPAILLECGVIVHREEELLVQEEAYQQLLAGSLVKALDLCMKSGVIELPSAEASANGASSTTEPAASLAPTPAKKKRRGILKRIFKAGE